MPHYCQACYRTLIGYFEVMKFMIFIFLVLVLGLNSAEIIVSGILYLPLQACFQLECIYTFVFKQPSQKILWNTTLDKVEKQFFCMVSLSSCSWNPVYPSFRFTRIVYQFFVTVWEEWVCGHFALDYKSVMDISM